MDKDKVAQEAFFQFMVHQDMFEQEQRRKKEAYNGDFSCLDGFGDDEKNDEDWL